MKEKKIPKSLNVQTINLFSSFSWKDLYKVYFKISLKLVIKEQIVAILKR